MSENNPQAFYLKYRPQSLSDLVGQEAVKKNLLSAFEQNRLSHAYLFVGPRGTGKTSTARILAKMVNCEEKDAPCNKCDICLSITDGSNMDLIEIDAASNRGIEDIRALREKIKLAPSGNKKKVYIIDEVHMLTTEAFNALLKTLEEPPMHALFILATTDVNKLPQTIISRVQRIDFQLASVSELKEALEKIIKIEKIDIESDALNLIIKRAEGSFRDAVKLLDQTNSLGEKITLENIIKNLNSSKFDDQISLLEKLAEKKNQKALIEVNKLVKMGADVKELIISLQDLMRSLMLIKNEVGEQLVKDNLTADKWEYLLKLADKFSSDDLIKGLDYLQQALEKLKFSSIPILPLEIAIVEICSGKGEINKMLDVRSEKLDQDVGSLKLEKKLEENPISNIQPQNQPFNIQHPISNDDILKLKEKWTFVLETIRPYNFSLEALLRSINITECSEKAVIMEVPYSFHQRILEAPKNRDLLESILSEILGRSIKVSTVLGSRPERKEDIANIEVAQDDEIIRVAAEIFNSDTIN